jgi:hypothetical protein
MSDDENLALRPIGPISSVPTSARGDWGEIIMATLSHEDDWIREKKIVLPRI